MPKKALFKLLLILAAMSVAVFFPWRIKPLEAPVQKALEDITGSKVTFSRILYKPYNQISVENLRIEGMASASITTVYFDLYKLARTRNITCSIRKIMVYAPDISLDALPGLRGIAGSTDARLTEAGKTMPDDIILFWNNGKLQYRGLSVSACAGNARIKNGIDAKITGKAFGGALDATLLLARRAEDKAVNVTAQYRGARSELAAKVYATIKPGQSTEVYFEIPKLSFFGYSLEGSSGSLRSGSAGITGALATKAGRISVEGNNFAALVSSGSLKLAAFRGISGGTLDFRAFLSEENFGLSAKLKSLKAGNAGIESANLDFSSKRGDNTVFSGRLDPPGYAFKGTVTDTGRFSVRFTSNNEWAGDGTARIKGALEPFFAELEASKIDISDLPGLGARYPGIGGEFSLKGRADSFSQKYEARLDGFGLSGIPRRDLRFKVLNSKRNWYFYADTSAKDLSIRLILGRNRQLRAAADFNACRLEDYAAFLGLAGKIKGELTGHAFFMQPHSGKFELRAAGIAYGGTSAGDIEISAVMDDNRALIEKLSIAAGQGRINAKGVIGYSPQEKDTSLSVTMLQFPLNGSMLDGRFNLKGRTSLQSGEPVLSWTAKSTKLRYGKWFTKDFSALVKYTEGTLSIKDILVYPYAKGELFIDIPYKTVNGLVSFEGLPLANFTSLLKGYAEGSVKISGNLRSPDIELEYTAPQTGVKDFFFDHSGKLHYFNRQLVLKNLLAESGGGRAQIEGMLLPTFGLKAVITDLRAELAAKAAGVEKVAGGMISGRAALSGAPDAPVLMASLKGSGIDYGGTLIDQLDADFIGEKGAIEITSAEAKSPGGEIKIHPGSRVDLKNSAFVLNAEMRNFHLGPVEALGLLTISGNYDLKETGRPKLNANLVSDSLWLNQHNLTALNTTLNYSSGRITFNTDKGQPLSISGSIYAGGLPELKFDNFSIVYDRAGRFSVQGVLGGNSWDFKVSGKGLDASAAAELSGLTFQCEGSMDMEVSGKGSMESPQIDADILLRSGRISEIPYDRIELGLSARQDVITILKSRLEKNGLFSIIASGYSPFFLTQAGSKRTRNNALDLNLTVEEGSLSMLKGLTSDIADAKGSFRAQAHITGTLAKPVANGYFKTTGGEVLLKRYFKKLGSINIDLVWKNNLLSFKEFTGKIGEGAIRATGDILFSGFQPKRYNITLQTEGKRGVPIFVPELPIPTSLIKTEDWQLLSNFSAGEPRFSISFSGPSDSPLLSGWADLENTHFTYPSLAKSSGNETILDELWPKLNWNLELRASNNTWYENDLVSVNVNGGIRLSGKGAAPTVNGRIEAVRGNIEYLGTEFKIVKASVDIVKDDVILEGLAETEVYSSETADNDVIQMYIDKGTIDKIQPRFVSRNNPELTPEKAMARATGIRTDTTSSSEMSFMLRRSIIRLLDSTLTTPLAKNLLRRSGIVDSFRVQYVSKDAATPENPANPTIPELLSGTKYSLEKYVTDKMLFGYSMTLDELQDKLSPRHELEVSYNLLKNMFLKGTYEIESRNPLHKYDRRITLEQQWRFGAPKKRDKK